MRGAGVSSTDPWCTSPTTPTIAKWFVSPNVSVCPIGLRFGEVLLRQRLVDDERDRRARAVLLRQVASRDQRNAHREKKPSLVNISVARGS